MSKRAVNVDLWAGIVAIGMTLAFWGQVLDREMFSVYGLYFPDRVLPLLLALGVVILIKGLTRPTRKTEFCRELNGKMALTILISAAWVLSMDFLGFLISSAVAMLLLFLLFLPRPQWTLKSLAAMVIIIACELAFMWVVFNEFLAVLLPLGFLYR